MKRKLLLSLLSAFTFLAVTSNTGGPAAGGNGNHSGSAGSSATCSGPTCHSNNTTATTASISLKDKLTSVVVTNGKYVHNRVYVVTISGSNTGALPRFGFQLSTVRTAATSTQAGTFSNFPSNVHQTASGGLSLVEHSAPILATAGNYTTSFDWTAPNAGTGSVTFFMTLNAVNFNAQSTGDAPNATTAVFTENTTSIASVENDLKLSLYPNPAVNTLTVETGATSAGTYAVCIYDLKGSRVLNNSVQILGANEKLSLDVSGLPGGAYYLLLSRDGQHQAAGFVKK